MSVDLARGNSGIGARGALPAVASLVLAFALALVLLALAPREAAGDDELPSGFRESVALEGLTNPTAVQFSADGRIFVAEKSGLIKVFDNLSDPTPATFADLRTNVHNFWDRGLLGLALDPGFPAEPYVYVLYTHDAPIGGTAPRWGSPGATYDSCPNPPGPTGAGCVVSGRLSRLQASGDTTTGREKVLIEGWCQQYPSHSVGSLAFGRDGALYVSGGDGASFNFADYGQGGGSDGSPTPKNPCGDPPVGVGGAQTPPTAEGGALRSQDLRTTRDPTALNGTILRVDPATGDALPDNPLRASSDPNARRIIAYGMRNPFRITARPGTDEVWVGDVGWYVSEEIDRIGDPTGSVVENFGWPCYEGAGPQGGYEAANLDVCKNLYDDPGAVTSPLYTYKHSKQVVAGETCPSGGSSIAGLAFYEGGSYPAAYDGALFFADFSRNCIWAMQKRANGLPDPARRETFVDGAAGPVGLQIGPGGDLFYVDFIGGTIRRISYDAPGGGTTCPRGKYLAEYFAGTRTPGGTPTFERCETRVDNDWDFGGPGNGVGTDNFAARWSGTHDFQAGSYTFTARADDGVRVWVDDELIIDQWRDQGASTYEAAREMSAGPHEVKVEYYENTGRAVAQVSWREDGGNTPPVATIDSPSSALNWKVGDVIDFSGSAADAQDGALPASALSWSLIMHHCRSADNCHAHPLEGFDDVAAGSFTAPDHDYPSYLELRLTATDSGGSRDTQSVRLDPRTATLNFRTNPAGLRLVAGSGGAATPFDRTVIVGSKNSMSAPWAQTLSGSAYEFASWSDGGAQTHDVTAGASAATYTASYAPAAPPTGSVVIDGGARSTKKSIVRLTLSAKDPKPGSGMESMQVSNDGKTWSEWEPYATSKSWTLPKGKGTKTVYVAFRDRAGNVSPTVSDTIKKTTR